MTETSFHNMSVSFWYRPTFTSFGYVHGSGLFRNPIDCFCSKTDIFLQISWKSIQNFLNNQRQKQKDKENRTNLITYCFAANSAFYPHSDRRRVRPKCGDALRLESKGRYCSFRMWIKVWITVKLCDPLLTRAIPPRLEIIECCLQSVVQIYWF